MPLVRLFERIASGERVRACVSAPPRHGKTELEMHGAAWLMRQRPEWQFALIGYAATFAEKKSRKTRQLAVKAGVPMAADAASRRDWRTGVEDGGMWATSVGGQVTGEGFHVMLVDDPTKGRIEAESAVKREHVNEWFDDDAYTRLEPNGSCIVTQTRWHTNDLSGHLLESGAWEHVCLPAIAETDEPDGRRIGEPLWPERWSLESLEETRDHLGGETGYGWVSLYQGRPNPRGGAVFHGDVHVAERPTHDVRFAIGFDLAYTAKRRADWSVAVVMAMVGKTAYVIDVVRKQCEVPEFETELVRLAIDYPSASVASYVSAQEAGIVALLAKNPVLSRAEALPARAEKFIRAQATAAAWNAGRIMLPSGRVPWAADFVHEVKSFTGADGGRDDQVDAMVAAFDVLEAGASASFESGLGDEFFHNVSPRRH